MYFAVNNNKEGKEVIEFFKHYDDKLEIREYSTTIFVNTRSNVHGYISRVYGGYVLNVYDPDKQEASKSISIEKFETIYGF